MKKIISKLSALIAVAAIVACFVIGLVACNKDDTPAETSQALTAKEAEDTLSKAFRIISDGSVTNLKVVFSETDGEVKRAGEASENYVKYAFLYPASEMNKRDITITYSNISTLSGGVESNKTYYYAYDYKKSDNSYVGPYCISKIDGVVENEGFVDENYVDDVNLANSLVSNSGLNVANSRMSKVKNAMTNDDYATISYEGKEIYLNDVYVRTEVTVKYSYTDNANKKIDGVVNATIIKSDYADGEETVNGYVLSSVSFTESDYTLSANYIYNIDAVEVPLTSENWPAEVAIA